MDLTLTGATLSSSNAKPKPKSQKPTDNPTSPAEIFKALSLVSDPNRQKKSCCSHHGAHEKEETGKPTLKDLNLVPITTITTATTTTITPPNKNCGASHKHNPKGGCCSPKQDDTTTTKKNAMGIVGSQESPEKALERLLSNSDANARASALLTAVKVGTYEGFERLCNAVLKLEQQQSTHVAEKSELCGYLDKKTTLAHWAAKRNDVQFLQFLCSDNIPGGMQLLQMKSLDEPGMYPLHWATTSGSIPVVAFLLEKLQLLSHSNNPSQSSSNIYHTSFADEQSNHSSIINITDNNGNTPLIVAAQYGHADLCAFLIKRGADTMALDHSRDSALHWAAYKGVASVTGVLCHIGWNRSQNNSLSIHLNSSGDSLSSQQQVQHVHHNSNNLKNHYQDWLPLDATDNFGQTPLHLASLRGNAETVQYLLEEAQNRQHAIHQMQSQKSSYRKSNHLNITSRRESDMVRYLLTLPDKDGKTPLDLAIQKQKAACQMILKEWEEQLHLGSHNQQSTLVKYSTKIKSICSLKQWKSWMGVGLGNDINSLTLQQQNMKWPFALVMGSMTMTTLIYPLKFTPFFNTEAGLLWDHMLLHMIYYFFFAGTWFLLLKTWRTNPGVLGEDCNNNSNNKRKQNMTPLDKEIDALTQKYSLLYDETLESYATSHSPTANTNKPTLPLCHSCHIARPFRSKHCRIRRKCVLMFDHYCPFVGNVVGLYNYAYFYFFLLSMVISQIIFLINTYMYLVRVQQFDWGMLFIGCFIFATTLLSSSLLVYHTQLIKRDLTTNEHQNANRYDYLKNERNEFFNPWNRGFIRNLLNRLSPSEALYTTPQQWQRTNHQQQQSQFRALSVDHGNDDNKDPKDSETRDLLSHQV